MSCSIYSIRKIILVPLKWEIPLLSHPSHNFSSLVNTYYIKTNSRRLYEKRVGVGNLRKRGGSQVSLFAIKDAVFHVTHEGIPDIILHLGGHEIGRGIPSCNLEPADTDIV